MKIDRQKVEAPSGFHAFALRRTRNNAQGTRRIKYSKSECDWFFLLDVEMNAWFIPFDKLSGRNSVTPSLTYPGYQIMRQGRWV